MTSLIGALYFFRAQKYLIRNFLPMIIIIVVVAFLLAVVTLLVLSSLFLLILLFPLLLRFVEEIVESHLLVDEKLVLGRGAVDLTNVLLRLLDVHHVLFELRPATFQLHFRDLVKQIFGE